MLHADEADDQYAVAAGLYDRQQWKPAVDEFQTFLQKFPNDPRANQARLLPRRGPAASWANSTRPASNSTLTSNASPTASSRGPPCSDPAKRPIWPESSDDAKPDLDAFLAKYPADRLNAYVLPYLGDIALAKGDAAAGGRATFAMA